MRGLTTHSTGARVGLIFIVNLSISALRARPVNSGVRHASLKQASPELEVKLDRSRDANLNFVQQSSLYQVVFKSERVFLADARPPLFHVWLTIWVVSFGNLVHLVNHIHIAHWASPPFFL